MMTDKKFDKLLREAADVLSKMPKAHNFAHRTIYNGTALTTSWYLEESEMQEFTTKEENALWVGPNPVERFVLDCEKNISHLMGALKELAADYDSLEQQYNEYKAMQPSETAKELYDHVNGRGIQLIDILVDRDKAHLKVENQKPQEIVLDTDTTFTTAHQPEETPKTATWVEEDDGYYYCSACHWRSGVYWKECPACSAKMETVTRDYGEEDHDKTKED